MSIIKRARAGAAAPIRRRAEGLSSGLESLIHAVKNELIDRFDAVDASVSELTSATTDSLGLQSARIAALEAELKALRAEIAALKKPQ